MAVNILLVAIWSFAGGGEFWPLIPIVVWGAAWLTPSTRRSSDSVPASAATS